MTIEQKKQVTPNVPENKENRAGDNDDGVNADELMGTTHSEYSSEGDDTMLSDDVG